MDENRNVQEALINVFDNEIALCSSLQLFEANLAGLINEMISKNFERLISVLYRLDVSEQKLKEELAHASGENAGAIIARLIIERQIEKMKARSSFTGKPKPGDEESW